MQIAIAKAIDSDLAELLALYRYLHATDPEITLADAKPLWQQMVQDTKIHVIVARVDDRVVSSCTIIIVPNLTRGGRPYALIENVVTHPDYRRLGIARRVLHHAVDLAWESNCYKVMLMTGRKDDGITAFYVDCGFNADSKSAFEIRR